MPMGHGQEEAVKGEMLMWIQLFGFLQGVDGILPVPGPVASDAERVPGYRRMSGVISTARCAQVRAFSTH